MPPCSVLKSLLSVDLGSWILFWKWLLDFDVDSSWSLLEERNILRVAFINGSRCWQQLELANYLLVDNNFDLIDPNRSLTTVVVPYSQVARITTEILDSEVHKAC